MTERARSSVLDEYLVVQSQLGDPAAFTRLVKRWHPRLLRQAYRYTRDASAAQDVAQESWMAVVGGLRSLRDPAGFRAWSFRIVSNKARDWVRREQARRRAVGRPEAGKAVAGRFEAEESAGGTTGESAGLRRVREGLAELAPDQRLVLTWFYLEEMSVREIAEALEIPVGTVKSRLHYARSALRARLEETP